MENSFNKKIMIRQLAIVTFVVITVLSTVATQAYSIQQTAGGDTVTISPGETKPITWGLLNDAVNQTLRMDISVTGNGAEFISMPKTVDLIPQEFVDIEGTVTIPQNFTSGTTLTATLTAERSNLPDASTLADDMNGSVAQIKIIPTKILTIQVQ